jgi:hypothetical protein
MAKVPSYMLVFMSSFTAENMAENAEILEITVIFMILNFIAPPSSPGQRDCG